VPASAAAAALLISHMSIDGEVTSSSQAVSTIGDSDSGKASTIVVGEDGHVTTQQAAAAISPGASSSCSLPISVTDIESIRLTCTRELDHTSGCGAGLSSGNVMATEQTTSSHYMAVVEVRGWKSKCAEQFYNAVILANVLCTNWLCVEWCAANDCTCIMCLCSAQSHYAGEASGQVRWSSAAYNATSCQSSTYQRQHLWAADSHIEAGNQGVWVWVRAVALCTHFDCSCLLARHTTCRYPQ
jgi:hypothetical protein